MRVIIASETIESVLLALLSLYLALFCSKENMLRATKFSSNSEETPHRKQLKNQSVIGERIHKGCLKRVDSKFRFEKDGLHQVKEVIVGLEP